MEIDEERQSLPPSQAASTSASRPLSSASVHRGSSSESRQSEDTALVSDSAFQTPDAGISALSLPPLSSPPTSANAREHDDATQPGQLHDSGIDTSTTINRISNHFSHSMPNLPPLMPAGEDRPDLWRNDFEPPTFRPRIQRGDAAAQFAVDRFDEVGVDDDTNNRPRPRPRGARRIFVFLGYGTGNRYRKELVSLIWNLVFGFIQITVTLALVIYASIHHSPRDQSISEWTACDKPLGIWACFWIVKVVLDSGMTYWGWRRDWKNRQHGQSRPEGDAEQGASNPGPDTIAPVDTNLDPPAIGAMDRQRRRLDINSGHYRLYSRLALSLFLSLIIISWFLTSNILLFTSLHTCRFAAPHLWWLVFSLLCLQYLVILEILATAVIVFIIGPLIYLFWSIILICLGRHPLQNPHYISPEIGKVSKSVVDQIPLVLYIPTPPDGEETDGIALPDAPEKFEASNAPKTTSGHTYPPKQPTPKRRFTFLSKRSSKSVPGRDNAVKSATPPDEKSATVWEDCWESGEYPFVRLDPHRASCAICLLDFEEPKRRVAREVIQSWAQQNKEASRSQVAVDENGSKNNEKQETQTSGADAAGASSSNQESSPSSPSSPSSRPQGSIQTPTSYSSRTNGDELSIRLEDVGEGAQPLRLLRCGHAFHKTCIDPWLIDVSGRCPTCQRPVVSPDPPRKKRNRNNSQ